MCTLPAKLDKLLFPCIFSDRSLVPCPSGFGVNMIIETPYGEGAKMDKPRPKINGPRNRKIFWIWAITINLLVFAIASYLKILMPSAI